MKQATLSLVEELKEKQEDFQWYPTTDEILTVVAKNVAGRIDRYRLSILDIGAGNGSALNKLQNFLQQKKSRDDDSSLYKVEKFAIEKSQTLISNMNNDIFILGTDFMQQTLIDKDVDIIFCNPPYSEFEIWMKKILTESNAELNYFVVPTRWKNNKEIEVIIEQRNMRVDNLGLFTFEKAERQARAVVDILCIKKSKKDGTSAFEVWFKNTFKINAEKDKVYESDFIDKKEKEIKQTLVKGQNLIEQLEELYKNDMQKLLNNYKSLENLDYDLFKELAIDINSLKKSLEEKIKGLKRLYWNELFNNLTAITDRLTSKSRKDMLDILQENTCIDYTSENAYAIVLWAIKNANLYIDNQMVYIYKELTDIDNISGYKSNKHYIDDNFKSYGKENDKYGWERNNKNQELRKGKNAYKLDYRLVHYIGTTFGYYGYDNNKLSGNASTFIEDVITIGKTLGFDVKDKHCINGSWASGKKYTFYTKNNEIFMEIRVYLKGTIHYKFNQDFMKKFNLEVGRLLGWLKDYKQASQELDIPIALTMKYFNNSIQKIQNSNIKLLAC